MLVVGAGALGCAAATAFLRARVARVTLIDDDIVELSNLQRQVLFDERSIGANKAVAAARALSAMTTTTMIDARPERVDNSNVDGHLLGHDLIVDATDDRETKYLLNDAAIRSDTLHVYGGIARTGGLALPVRPGLSACLACAFPPTQAANDGGCDRLGILAPVAGVIGTLQAQLALRLWAGHGDVAGTLFVYELRGRRWRILRFPRAPGCPVCAATGNSCVEIEEERPCPS